MKVTEALARRGGVATRAELEGMGCDPETLQMAVDYGNAIKVRRGVYASLGTPELALRALRVGGLLACASALEFYGIAGPSAKLHVQVAANASRFRIGDEDVVLHWKRRREYSGRLAVLPETARRQARLCPHALVPQRGQQISIRAAPVERLSS